MSFLANPDKNVRAQEASGILLCSWFDRLTTNGLLKSSGIWIPAIPAGITVNQLK
jgi:hypothetical protein